MSTTQKTFRRNFGQIIDSGSWEQKYSVDSAYANLLSNVRAFESKDYDGVSREVVYADYNGAALTVSTAANFAGLPKGSVLTDLTNHLQLVKTADSGTSDWYYSATLTHLT